jgi:uncharacterized protein (TIGR02001 family)
MKKLILTSAVSALGLLASTSSFAQLSASATITNNYLWRGLTQSMNEAAIQGGVKYTGASGAYVGTWVSNVEYDPGDSYSYENDLYFGFAGTLSEGIGYDLGYLYYNYDENAGFDFGEVYGTLTVGNLALKAFFLTNAEPDEVALGRPDWDFAAFETYYFSGDYSVPLASGAVVGLHMGYHYGDFAQAFNGVTEGYLDYNVSIAKDGFIGMISMTDLDGDDDNDGAEDYANMPPRDNDEIKFVVGYTMNFEL